MLQKIINYFDHFNPEILYTLFGILLINIGLFLWFWFHNKKKIETMAHQVPPEVVKSYVDSMMQNSSASNSMVGVQTQNPSIVTAEQLTGGGNISVGASDNNEMLAKKNSELKSLKEQLNNKTNQIGEKELKIEELDLEVEQKNNYIAELEAKLKGAEDPGNSNKTEVDNLIKERDELKERLDEYAVIEDDLADLKRYKQENEELRQALEGSDSADIASLDSDDNDDEASNFESEELVDDEDTPDSLEALADALEKESSADDDSGESIPDTAENSDKNILNDAASIMDEIVGRDSDSDDETNTAEGSLEEEAKQVIAGTENEQEEDTVVSGNQEEAEEVVVASAENEDETEDTEPNKTAKAIDDDENQVVAAANDEEGSEEPVAQVAEEEKSLDDLLSEFEKMLG